MGDLAHPQSRPTVWPDAPCPPAGGGHHPLCRPPDIGVTDDAGDGVIVGRIVVKTTTVEAAERGRSPLGSHIRFLMDGPHGNMIHATVPPGMVGRACRFRTVEEYWFVLSGDGEIWRRSPDGQESVTRLIPGV